MSNMQDEIDEILTDCYGENEGMSGWECTFSDRVEIPFPATLMGIPVEVQGFRANNANTLQCQIQCQIRTLYLREEKQRWIGIEDLDEDGLPQDFRHLLALYRVWSKGSE